MDTTPTHLREIAESILDPAAAAYLAVNVEDAGAVAAYAENAMGLYISDEDAERVRTVCLSVSGIIADGGIPSSLQYHEVMATLDAGGGV